MKNNQILKNNLGAIDKATKKIMSFVDALIDEASFVETDVFAAGKSFIDGSEALGEGVVTGYATINGNPVNIFAQNSEVLGGSFGEAQAKKIKKVIQKAVSSGTPLISVIDSTGARAGEGVAMLEAYADIIVGATVAREEIPHICIVKGACVGMMASYAATADYLFMSQDSVMSVNSPQALVAESANDYPKLNSVLGYDAYGANSCVADFTYKNQKDLAEQLAKLLEIIGGDVNEPTDDANRETPALDKAYTTDGALAAICDDGKYMEANANYAKEVRTVLTKVNGISVGILATDSSVAGGYITLDGVVKATDFVELCGENNFPLITLVDAKGIKTCLGCETKGASRLIAKLMSAVASSSNSKIGVIAGKATGVIYSALASKGIGFDYTLACVDAEIAPINAETAVNVFYSEELKKAANPQEAREKLAAKYRELEANPFIAAKEGYIDNIVEAGALRPYIASALLMLLGI